MCEYKFPEDLGLTFQIENLIEGKGVMLDVKFYEKGNRTRMNDFIYLHVYLSLHFFPRHVPAFGQIEQEFLRKHVRLRKIP